MGSAFIPCPRCGRTYISGEPHACRATLEEAGDKLRDDTPSIVGAGDDAMLKWKSKLAADASVDRAKANATQVGGDHYATPIQHWDYVVANDLGYFEAQITKYVTRWHKKGGLQDLHKAQHFLAKLIEIVEAGGTGGTNA